MKYLTDYTEDLQTKCFNKYNAFFAFSQTQFEEKYTKGTKYVHLGTGLYCPKYTYKELINELDTIQSEGIKQDVKDNGAVAIIEREYFNLETQISMNTDALFDRMQPYQNIHPNQFTKETILQVSKKCFKKAVKNDWF